MELSFILYFICAFSVLGATIYSLATDRNKTACSLIAFIGTVLCVIIILHDIIIRIPST